MAHVTWLASFPKSGNTWVRTLVANYLRDEDDLDVMSQDGLTALVPDLVTVMSGGRVLPLDGPGTVVVKTHFLPGVELLRAHRRETRKAIYLVRNPRDVIRSSARQLGVDPSRLAEFARYFIQHEGVPEWEDVGWGSWTENVGQWTDQDSRQQHFPDITVLVIRYEDLRADPTATLRRVIDFLALDSGTDQQRIDRAVARSSLERMRAAEAISLSGGFNAYRGQAPARQVSERGLTGQALSGLGDDVEAAYQRLLDEDGEFSRCARRFGYDH
jgi:hypothetical protein